VAIMAMQLALGIHAYVSHGDEIMLVFGTAIFLMEAIANMPVWSATRFSARKAGEKGSTYALMRGIGYRHVFVIRHVHPNA
jgi:hypothetical protein